MIGSGLRSVSHARSSTRSFGSGCSTYRNPRSFSQSIMSRACCRSVQPWLASPLIGLSVTERMASTIALVGVAAELDLQHLELGGFARLLLHDVGRVDADRERRHRRLRRVVAPDVVPGLPHQLADEVVQGDVDRRLGRRVARRERRRWPRGWTRARTGWRSGSRSTFARKPWRCRATRRGRAASTPRRSRPMPSYSISVSTTGVVVREFTATVNTCFSCSV